MIVFFLTGALVLLVGGLSGAALAMTLMKMIAEEDSSLMNEDHWYAEEEEEQ